METVKKYTILLACILAFGLMSCDDNVTVEGSAGNNSGGGSGSSGGRTDSALNGTWVGYEEGYTETNDAHSYEINFNNGNFEWSEFQRYMLLSIRFKGFYTTSAGIITITITHYQDYEGQNWVTNDRFSTESVPYYFANNNTLILDGETFTRK